MDSRETHEMHEYFKKNWQVKDNIIIAMNVFNRYHTFDINSTSSSLLSIDGMYKMCKFYAAKHNVSMLEASKVLKEFVKKNKEMRKNSLQNGIKEL